MGLSRGARSAGPRKPSGFWLSGPVLPFDAMPLTSVCDGGSGVGSGGSGSSVLDRCSFRLSVSWVRLFTFQAIFSFFFNLSLGDGNYQGMFGL